MALKLLGSLESSGGNVGIGTSSPDSKLHVEGSTDGTGTGADAILHVKQNGGWNGNEPWALYVEGYSYLNGFRINAADGIRALHKVSSGGQLGFSVTDTAPITFTQSNSTERMRVHTDGNVGIGTANPGARLEVASGQADTIINSTTAGQASRLRLKTTTREWRFGTHNGQSNNLWIYDATASAYRFVINTSGNVGMGTTSPNAPLHIGPLTGGNGTAQERLRLTGDYTATGSGVLLRFTNQHNSGANPNTGEYNLAGIVAYDYQSDWGGALAFQTAPSTSAGGNLTTRMTIDQFGKVGIGDTSPDTNLHVHSAGGSGVVTQIKVSQADDGAGHAGADAILQSSGWGEAFLKLGGHKAYAGGGDFNIESATDLALKSGGSTTRMFINSSGNIGMGTTGPIAKLDVQSTGLAANPTIQIVNTSSSTFNHSINALAPNLTTGENNIFIIGRAASNKNSGYIGYKYSAAGSNLNVLTFGHWNSNNLMNLTGDGKLGIGTENPAEKLEVVGTIKATSTGTATLILRGDSGNSGDTGQLDSTIKMLHDDENHGILLETRNYAGAQTFEIKSLTSGTETSRFLIDQDGTLKIPAYGAGFLTTDANGDVSVDASDYYTETELNGFFKSVTHQGNYISTANWSNDGSGSVNQGWGAEGYPFSPTGDFNQNGETAENIRTVAELPNGAYGVVWRTPSNDASSSSDGGWDMDIQNVQHAKAYRSVVYFQKTDDSTSGTFYHGCHGSHTLQMNGNPDTNPYFQTLGFSNLVENRWYVSVGYIQPYQYPTATNSTRSGIYDCYTGKKISNGTDYMMKSGSTTQRHRTYQYYSTDTSSSINWWSPRFEEINGNEPSLAELIQRVGVDGELGLNFHSKFPAGALDSLSETTDATNDKILLWDESADVWKQMTLEDLQDSIDTDTTNFAPLASPTLTGTPTAPTAGATVNTTQLATTAFVQTAIANLSDSAPATLNTLNELAAALGDDASFSTTVTTSIATKLPLAGGTMTGDLIIGEAASAGLTQAFGSFEQLKFDNSHSDSARGPNKIVMHDNGSAWVGGFGIHSDTVSYYTGGKHIWYKSSSQTAFSQQMSLSGTGTLALTGALNTNTINIGNTVTLTESTDRADLLYINSGTSSWGGLQVGNTSNEFIFSLMGNGSQGGIYDDQNDDWWIVWNENAGVQLKYNNTTRLVTTNTGVSVTGNIAATGDITASGTGSIGGKRSYTKTYGSLNTTGEDVAGLAAGGNGNSALFTFTCHGHSGGYQKIVYSCHNTSATTWNVKKVIDEGTNDFDVTVSDAAATRTFTFVSRSGTKSYSPTVHVEHVGHGFDSTHR
jgi:hypothetical protein